MLDGATAEAAYAVQCDETTNPPEETDQGHMVCLVGLQPPWPAEFVVIRIGKTETGVALLDTSSEVSDGGNR
jgi:phage tail sheath protein FI